MAIRMDDPLVPQANVQAQGPAAVEDVGQRLPVGVVVEGSQEAGLAGARPGPGCGAEPRSR